MLKSRLFLLLFALSTAISYAQSHAFFKPIAEKDIVLEKPLLHAPFASQYKTYQLDLPAVKQVLATAPWEFTAAARNNACQMYIPSERGVPELFSVWRTDMLEAPLYDAFPDIRTYAGRSMENPTRTVRFSVTVRGFRAMIMHPDQAVSFVEPYSWNQKSYYVAYDYDNLVRENKPVLANLWIPENEVNDLAVSPYMPPAENKQLDNELVNIKVYRYFVATTGEFSQDHGGTKPEAFSAVVEYSNMVSGFFERDADIRLKLTVPSEYVVHLDPTSDPYFGTTVQDWMSQNTQVLNTYNVTSYDVGHVYARYLGGSAIGVAGGNTCVNNSKARGCSAGVGQNDYGPGFLSVIGQEVGHQMSGGHTWQNCGDNGGRDGSQAYEPGSGSTIMSYAGACGPDNIQFNADLYFHSGSSEVFKNFYTFTVGNTCGETLASTNHHPTATAPYPDNFFIPISTPFELNGTGSDLDGDALTYSWDQIDWGAPASPLGQPVSNAATFRSLPAKLVTNRIFPKMSTVLSGNVDFAEQLPTYTRDLTFRFCVRDNQPDGGGIAWDDVAFQATADAGPFLVQSPNTTVATWLVGEYAEVKWDVANTNAAPVNCKTINIRLSTDGGQTYPVLLATAVDNDGSHYVLVPNNISTTARVKVEAADNIFFDISNANFKIQAPQNPSLTLSVENDYDVTCLPGSFSTIINTAAILGYSTPVTLSIDGLPAGVTANIGTNPLPAGGTTTIGFDLGNIPEGTYIFDLNAVSGNLNFTRKITLITYSNDFTALSLSSPADGSTLLGLAQTLRWTKGADALSYDVQFSKSPNFNTVLASASFTVADSLKIPFLLDKNSGYFWRVRPNNECGSHDWTEPFFFSTQVEDCRVFEAGDLPKALSSNGTPVVESVITINEGGIISDLNIKQFSGFHESFKHLDVMLISPDGTQRQVFKDKCGSFNGNFKMGFDDSALTPFTCPPVNNGAAIKPNQNFAIYNGQNATGPWKLLIKDVTVGSGGAINTFILEVCATKTVDPPFIVNNTGLTIPAGNNSIIDPAKLLVEDNNNTHPQLKYTLVSVPKFGELTNNFSAALKPGDTFTQADIDNGYLRFYDYGTNNNDSFRFVVDDGEAGYLATPTFVIQKPGVGTEDFENDVFTLTVSPNPAAQTVWIALDKAASADMDIWVYHGSGQLANHVVMSKGSDRLSLNIMNLPAGFYVIKGSQNGQTITRKLIIGR